MEEQGSEANVVSSDIPELNSEIKEDSDNISEYSGADDMGNPFSEDETFSE